MTVHLAGILSTTLFVPQSTPLNFHAASLPSDAMREQSSVISINSGISRDGTSDGEGLSRKLRCQQRGSGANRLAMPCPARRQVGVAVILVGVLRHGQGAVQWRG